MSINDNANFKMASLMGTIWNILMGIGAICIGILGRGIYFGTTNLPLGDKETLFLKLATDTFPPFIAGLIIAALISAIMSTVDSQILVIVSSITRDFLQKLLWKNKEIKNYVFISRMIVMLVIIVSVILGIFATYIPGIKTIYSYVLLAWAVLGAAFGPPIILSLYWKRTTAYGAISCLIIGPLLTIIFKILRTSFPNAGIPYELLISFTLSFITCVFVSLITPKDSGQF